MRYGQEVIGRKYNRLEVVGLIGVRDSEMVVEFRCDCGQGGEAPVWKLVSGAKRSCGCLRREATASRNRTHGLAHLPEYKVWVNIITRCYNPASKTYQRYGAKGVQMSDEWRESFEAFHRDMGPRPSPKHTVERKDNALGYCKENCRWATLTEQARNKSTSLHYTYGGVTKTLKEWSDDVGLDYHCAYWRHQQKWPIDRILTTPSRKRPKRPSTV